MGLRDSDDEGDDDGGIGDGRRRGSDGEGGVGGGGYRGGDDDDDDGRMGKGGGDRGDDDDRLSGSDDREPSMGRRATASEDDHEFSVFADSASMTLVAAIQPSCAMLSSSSMCLVKNKKMHIMMISLLSPL